MYRCVCACVCVCVFMKWIKYAVPYITSDFVIYIFHVLANEVY